MGLLQTLKLEKLEKLYEQRMLEFGFHVTSIYAWVDAKFHFGHT